MVKNYELSFKLLINLCNKEFTFNSFAPGKVSLLRARGSQYAKIVKYNALKNVEYQRVDKTLMLVHKKYSMLTRR